MAKKKVSPKKSNGILIKAATTIGKAAGRLAALVAPGDKAATKQEARRASRKPRPSTVKPRLARKASGANVASKKAKKTGTSRKQKG